MDYKRIFIISMLFVVGFIASSCSQYDSYRIKQTENHKQNYVEDVQRALEGKLTKLEFESSLQSFDTSMLEEESKNSATSLEKLKEKLDAETKKAIVATWGE